MLLSFLIFYNFLLTSNPVYIESLDLIRDYKQQLERENGIYHEFIEIRDSIKSKIEELSTSLTNLIIVSYDATNTNIEFNIRDSEIIENLWHAIRVQKHNLEQNEISLNNSAAKIQELQNLINDIESPVFLPL